MVNVCLKTLKFIKAHMHVNRTCEVEDLTTITSVFELSFYFGKYPFGVKIAGPVRYLVGGEKKLPKGLDSRDGLLYLICMRVHL